MAVKDKTNKAEEVKTEVETPSENEAEKASFFVYLGPNIHGVIQKASFYTGTRSEVEAQLATALGKYPRIKTLLASGENLPAAREEVNKPGTRLHAEYAKLVAELKK